MAASTSYKSLQRDWNDEELYKLIELYEEEQLLYNNTEKDYHNKAARRAAVGRIASNFEDCTAADVTRKWRILLIQFNSLKRRMRLKHGSEGDKKIASWKFYRAMAFIDKYSVERVFKGDPTTPGSETSEMDTDRDQSELSKISSWSDEIDQQEPTCSVPAVIRTARKEPKRYWNDEEIYKLIGLYEDEELLYNSTAKQYYSHAARHAAEDRIAAHFGCRGCDVVRKWRILLSQLNMYTRKLKTLGGNVRSKVNWKFYKPLSFIAKYKTKRVYNGGQYIPAVASATEMVALYET